MRQTKVQPPPLAANFIARPRLEELAERIIETGVTIVRAGGGFGKTTVLRAWADRLCSHHRVSWLSLEPQDASAAGMIEALNASFARSLDGFGNSAGQLLEQGIEQPVRLVSALSNELIAWIDEHDKHVVLFIDDVQFIVDEKSALDTLGELLRAAPERTHVVLASRSPLKFPPLSKLRAAGGVLEIEERDLRFNLSEATQLLADEQAAHAFVEQTEGWAIALGLTAQIVRAAPVGWHRAMSGSREAIFDFLAEEVIERLPTQLREQLFVLAVPVTIDDTYAPALLNADARFEQIVADMVARGLYIARLDDRSWRLHHLFRDFLLERFRRADARRLKALRVRYADLLRQNGNKMEALGQLLDADDYEQIVEYVQEALQTIWFTERYKAFLRLLSRVPDAVMRQHPMLHRFYAIALVRDRRVEQARKQLELCYERALGIGDIATACAAQLELGCAVNQFYFLRQGNFEKSESHFKVAIELAERPELRERPVARGIGHWHLGIALACRSEFERALEHLAIAEEIERQAASHTEAVLVEIATVHGWSGNWQRSLDYAELAEELLRTGGGQMQVGLALMAQAQAHLALHPTSPRCVEVAEAAVRALGADQPIELAAALVVLARAMLNKTPPALALCASALDEAAVRLESYPNPVVAFDMSMVRFEAELLSGRTDEAREHLSRTNMLAQSMGNPWQVAMVSFMAGLLELVCSNEYGAEVCFKTAAPKFAGIGDRYHYALALLSALACGARAGTLKQDAVKELFLYISRERLEYVCAGAPRSSLSVLIWCLKNECLIDVAEELVAPAVHSGISELAAIASDAHVRAQSRSAAIRIMAKAVPSESRAMISVFCRDADPLVAGTARATLDYLPAPQIQRIRIEVIGELTVTIREESLTDHDERWGRKRAAELLRFLAISNTAVSKSAVISALWPESESVADTTLRVTLHLLRRALQPGVEGSGDYIFYDGAIMRLNPDVVEGTDAEEADAALRRADLLLARGETQMAKEAFHLAIAVFSKTPREDDVSDWLRPHVRRWREQSVRAYHGLAKLERTAANTEGAIRAMQQALTFDPLNEQTVMLLLELYDELGELEAGRSAFVTYRRRLKEQIGTSPGPGVLERYASILQKRTAPSVGQLSTREREVLGLVSRGLSNKQIGTELGLSTWTVNNHVAKILKKLGVESRTAAAALAGGD